jgi:hypothetical protein
MFVGHYGPAVWDSHRTGGVKLWHGFLAVQAIDFVSMILSLLGVEGDALREGAHPLAFDIDWSHSLLSAVVISLLVAVIYRLLRPTAGRKAVWIIGLLALSHWPLDWLVHRPDLPLYPGGELMLGLGLWNFAWPAYVLEVGILGGMMAWWLSVTRGPVWTTLSACALVSVMAVIQFMIMTAPTLTFQADGTVPPAAGPSQAISGLVVFTLFAAIIALLERKRDARG